MRRDPLRSRGAVAFNRLWSRLGFLVSALVGCKYHDDPKPKQKLIRFDQLAYLQGPGRRVLERLDSFFKSDKGARGKRFDRRKSP